MSDGNDSRPLPYGWIQQYDPSSNHIFYVDTKANPPRSIWVHPYEDEQFLSEHPDIREKVRPDIKGHGMSGNNVPELPPYEKEDSSTVKSGNFESDDKYKHTRYISEPGQSLQAKNKKRGLFGKMKDVAIGTKEEREAAKKRDREWAEARRQEKLAHLSQQAAAEYGSEYYYRSQYGGSGSNFPGASGHYGTQSPQYMGYQMTNGPGPSHAPVQGYPQQGFNPQQGPHPHQAPYYGHQPNMVMYPPPPPQRNPGGSDMLLPILGGIAGGLFIGSLFG